MPVPLQGEGTANSMCRDRVAFRLALCGVLLAVGAMGHTPESCYLRRATWVETMVASRMALSEAHRAIGLPPQVPRIGRGDFSFAAWYRTENEGVLFSKARRDDGWVPGTKVFGINRDAVYYDCAHFDLHWTHYPQSRDNRWHHAAITVSNGVHTLYVDGQRSHSRPIRFKDEPEDAVLQIGYRQRDFPSRECAGFKGDLDEVYVYNRVISDREVANLASNCPPLRADGLIAWFPFENDVRDASAAGNHPQAEGDVTYTTGKVGRALALKGNNSRLIVTADNDQDFLELFWSRATNDFATAREKQEMDWEREDGIWRQPVGIDDYAGIGRRYALAAYRDPECVERIKGMLPTCRGMGDVRAVRRLYLRSRRHHVVRELKKRRDPTTSLAMVEMLRVASPPFVAHAALLRSRLEGLQAELEAWVTDALPDEVGRESWERAFDDVCRTMVRQAPDVCDFKKIIFVKRLRYVSNHYYTDYINGGFFPGGNICVLDLETGEVSEILKGFETGYLGRYDLSFDARRIVFAWKPSHDQGYRIYECNVDGSGVRQLTFPPENEGQLHRDYGLGYHHGTDDMDPCYLPDGGICFISTRCQYGILCDSPDVFTTTVLYRMDGDGRNMIKLTNSSVSEATPSVANDGRILYTRWEYVDKGAVSVKCIWSMRPDGTGSAEVYGNDIALPPTMTQARAIPGDHAAYVILGCPHFSQNSLGTVIRLDMRRDIRTRAPMTYMTPDVDVRGEGGYWWESGEPSRQRLFKDPYPLNAQWFLVTQATGGWDAYHSQTQWGVYLLNESGQVLHLYDDHPALGCFQPMPLKPRPVPPVVPSVRNEELASRDLAMCVVSDVTRGMEGIRPGQVKYLRINEQVPRPWAARRYWDGDLYDQQHACITKDTHLGLKVQHGIVPVAEDGSATFLVPADRNIFIQALDEHFMELQRERTYVNYRPGEVRGCIGCHERPADVPDMKAYVSTPPSQAPCLPGPQPGEETGRRALYFSRDVQPVLDRHCISCHAGKEPKGGLNLAGDMTEFFSVSYEQLLPERRDGAGRSRQKLDLVGPTIGENHPKTGNVHYLKPKSLGSHASLLVAMLYPQWVSLEDPVLAKRALELAETHRKIELSEAERIRLTTWVDSNGQYYGSWYGRRNLRYRDHPNFRPHHTHEQAVSTVAPLPRDMR